MPRRTRPPRTTGGPRRPSRPGRARAPELCAHCRGAGLCSQPCCTTFGYTVLANTDAGPVSRAACAHCQGTGYPVPRG